MFRLLEIFANYANIVPLCEFPYTYAARVILITFAFVFGLSFLTVWVTSKTRLRRIFYF